MVYDRLDKIGMREEQGRATGNDKRLGKHE